LGGNKSLAEPKNVFDFTLEVRKIKGLFNKTADALKFEKGLHGRSGTRQHDHRKLPHAGLLRGIIVTVRTELAEERETVLSLGDPDIEKHAIGPTFFNPLVALSAFIGGQNLIAQMLELFFDDLTNVILVINDKNTFLALRHFDLSYGDTTLRFRIIVKITRN